MGTNGRPKSLSDVRIWLANAPPGTTIPAESMLAAIGEVESAETDGHAPARVEPVPLTWREKLWLVPAETRIGTAELCEALGRSKHWLYRHTGPAAKERIPHRKLDGELVFVIGEVRTWIREHEDVIEAMFMESTKQEMR